MESTHTIFAAISQFDMHTCYISHAMSSISPSFVDHSVTLDRLRVEGSEVAGITQQQVSPNPHLSANQDKTNYILTHRRFSREVIVIPPLPPSPTPARSIVVPRKSQVIQKSGRRFLHLLSRKWFFHLHSQSIIDYGSTKAADDVDGLRARRCCGSQYSGKILSNPWLVSIAERSRPKITTLAISDSVYIIPVHSSLKQKLSK